MRKKLFVSIDRSYLESQPDECCLIVATTDQEGKIIILDSAQMLTRERTRPEREVSIKKEIDKMKQKHNIDNFAVIKDEH